MYQTPQRLVKVSIVDMAKCINIAIHDGIYHFDELLAVAILLEANDIKLGRLGLVENRLKLCDDGILKVISENLPHEYRVLAEIVRISRNYQGDYSEFDYVIDVSTCFDNIKFFDHHQDKRLGCAAKLVSNSFGFPSTNVLDLVNEQDLTGKQNFLKSDDIITDFNYIRALWLKDLRAIELAKIAESICISNATYSDGQVDPWVDLSDLDINPELESAILSHLGHTKILWVVFKQGSNFKHIAVKHDDGSQELFGDKISQWDGVIYTHPTRFMFVATWKCCR